VRRLHNFRNLKQPIGLFKSNMLGAMQLYGISQRRACVALGVKRSTIRHQVRCAGDEAGLRSDIILLSSRYRRYGYRRITAMLHAEGWGVNHKRVERIWREEGLKIPRKQPKRGRLYLNDGSQKLETGLQIRGWTQKGDVISKYEPFHPRP
jgi:hypothetical protein